MADLDFQNFSTVQNKNQPQPVTLAAAATIAPTTFITFVSGTTVVATITPPVTGSHMLALLFTATNPGTFTTTGNILQAVSPATSSAVTFMLYNPITAKYSVAKTTNA